MREHSKKIHILQMVLFVMLLTCAVNATVFAAEKTTTVTLNGDWKSLSFSADGDILEYFFTLPSDGKVTLTYQAFRSATRLQVKNGDQTTQYHDAAIHDASSVSPVTSQYTLFLKKGRYQVYAYDNGANFYGGDGAVRVKIAFKSGETTETEPNDSFDTAMTLSRGTSVTAALTKIDDRLDFFKFSSSSSHKVEIKITTRFIDEVVNNAICVILYNQDFEQVGTFDVQGGHEAGPNVTSRVFDVSNGTYYIRIDDDYYGDDQTFGVYDIVWNNFAYDLADASKPADVKLSCTACTYSGTAKKPSVTVTYDGKKLTKDTDYTLSYSNNINAGYAYAIVNGKGGYKGTVKKRFTIQKASPALSLETSSKSIGGVYLDQHFGASFTIKATAKTSVSYSSSSSYITVGTTGKVTVKRAIPKGTYKIIVRAAGSSNYLGSRRDFTLKITSNVCPDNQKYWVIFSQGSRGGRTELATFNSPLSVSQLHLVWVKGKSLALSNKTGAGKVKHYYLTSDNHWKYFATSSSIASSVPKIYASRLYVRNKSGNLLMEKKSYSKVDLKALP